MESLIKRLKMHDISYEGFRKFFSYLKDKGVISIDENSDLLTEYLQNAFVTFDSLSEFKSKEANTISNFYSSSSWRFEECSSLSIPKRLNGPPFSFFYSFCFYRR